MTEKTKTCPKCKQPYRLGYDGTGKGCDKCLKVKRDANGYAWFSHENGKTLQPLDGSPEYTITREEAFGKAP